MAQQGGSADKIGGEYEGWWTLWRLTELLRGRATAMQLEPMGADGVELWIEQDGIRTYDQAKLRSHGTWTIGRLVSDRVITRVLPHLQAGNRVQFILSSSSDSLSRLTVDAAGSDSSEAFANAVPAEDLSQLLSAWNVDLETGWRYLRSVSVRRSGLEDLADFALLSIEQVVVGDPHVVASVLKDAIPGLVQRTITAQDIWSLLQRAGIEPRPRIEPGPASTRIRASLERQRVRTLGLIPDAGVLTSDLAELRALAQTTEPNILVVHGKAGSGKSSLVTKVAIELEAAGRYVAAVRLDQVSGTTITARQLGAAADLGGSPVSVLSEISHGGAPGVLIVDQLDAVSTYSGRSPEVFAAVEDLVRQARLVGNVTVILVARTVDLLEDPRLRALADAEDVQKFQLSTLSQHDVRRYLDGRGINTRSLSAVTVELLQTPIHLYVFCQLRADVQLGPFVALSDLYEAYTQGFRKKLELEGFPPAWSSIAKTMVRRMNEAEALFCPLSALDEEPQTLLGALISANVLVHDGPNVAFFHETYFDYLFARSFEPRGADLVDWFLKSGQTLFRRSQLRQVLTYVSSQEPSSFMPTVRLIVESKMRTHLVAIALSVVPSHQPVLQDWIAVRELITLDGPFSAALIDVMSIPAWFRLADEAGDVESLLRSVRYSERTGQAIGRLFDRSPDRVLELLQPLTAEGDQWVSLLRQVVSMADTPDVFTRVAAMIRSGALDISESDRFVPLGSTLMYRAVDAHPVSAIQILAAYLERAFDLAAELGSSDPLAAGALDDRQSFEGLDQLASRAPETLVVELGDVMFKLAKTSDANLGRRWRYRSPGHHFGLTEELFFAFDKALTMTASTNFSLVASFVDELTRSGDEPLLFLACRAMLHAPADLGAEWLLETSDRLHIGWMSNGSWESRRLIDRVAEDCSDALFARLETSLLDYFPDYERRATALSLQYRGLSQLELLSALPLSRLSEMTRRRLEELKRKFPEYQPTEPTGPTGGTVGAPIAGGATLLMSDRQWRGAIQRYGADEETRFGPNGPVGGASELAQVLGARAKDEPKRFLELALTFDSTTNPTYAEHVLRNVAGLVPEEDALRLARKFATDHGASSGRAVVAAVDAYSESLSDDGFQLLVRLLSDADPSQEEARIETGSGYRYGGDLITAGINSVRGGAVATLAKVLFANSSRAAAAAVEIDRLVVDPIMAVRSLVAEPVLAVFNSDLGAALQWAERLLSGETELLSGSSFLRLLHYSVLNDPDRFAGFLASALQGPSSLAAGSVWINALVNDAVRDPVPRSFDQLSDSARAGAAESLGGNPRLDPKLMAIMLADADENVRKRASGALFHLDALGTADAELLASTALENLGKDESLGSLLHALLESSRLLQSISLRVAEIAVTELELGASSAARISPYQVVALILRLYRQGAHETQERCLDLVDRLSVIRAWDLDRALELGDG